MSILKRAAQRDLLFALSFSGSLVNKQCQTRDDRRRWPPSPHGHTTAQTTTTTSRRPQESLPAGCCALSPGPDAVARALKPNVNPNPNPRSTRMYARRRSVPNVILSFPDFAVFGHIPAKTGNSTPTDRSIPGSSHSPLPWIEPSLDS